MTHTETENLILNVLTNSFDYKAGSFLYDGVVFNVDLSYDNKIDTVVVNLTTILTETLVSIGLQARPALILSHISRAMNNAFDAMC